MHVPKHSCNWAELQCQRMHARFVSVTASCLLQMANVSTQEHTVICLAFNADEHLL